MMTKHALLIKQLILLVFISLAFMNSASYAQVSIRALDALKGLQVGDDAPLFNLENQDEEVVLLEDILKEGPVVLVFYRGQWCPICNRHLGRFQDSLSLINSLDASVIAISPEQPEYLYAMKDKVDLEFDLLYDRGYFVASEFGLLFDPGQSLRDRYDKLLSANFRDAHQDERGLLPIPATFIIGQDGKIAWRQFNPNYKKRSSVSEIIDALKAIN